MNVVITGDFTFPHSLAGNKNIPSDPKERKARQMVVVFFGCGGCIGHLSHLRLKPDVARKPWVYVGSVWTCWP